MCVLHRKRKNIAKTTFILSKTDKTVIIEVSSFKPCNQRKPKASIFYQQQNSNSNRSEYRFGKKTFFTSKI